MTKLRKLISHSLRSLAGVQKVEPDLPPAPGDEMRSIPDAQRWNPEMYPESFDYYTQVYWNSYELEKKCGSDYRTANSSTAVQLAYKNGSVARQRRHRAADAISTKGLNAIDFAVHLLGNRDPNLREDGAGIIYLVGQDGKCFDALCRALEKETNLTVYSGMLEALAKTGARKAVPVLARIVMDDRVDKDVAWNALVLLGRIVGVDFSKQNLNALEAARTWVESHLPQRDYPGPGSGLNFQ